LLSLEHGRRILMSSIRIRDHMNQRDCDFYTDLMAGAVTSMQELAYDLSSKASNE